MLLLFAEQVNRRNAAVNELRLMTSGKTSRRQFVQLAGGLALMLRQWTAAGPDRDRFRTDVRNPARGTAAAIGDAALRIEWDSNLHARVSRRSGRRWIPMTAWGASEYLLDADGRHIADFAIRHQVQERIADANGPGTRLTLSGTSIDGVEKTMAVTFMSAIPDIALFRVSYRNTAARILSIQSWTNGDSGCSPPARMHRNSGATPARRITIAATGCNPSRPASRKRISSGWRRPTTAAARPSSISGASDGGLAVGHLETTPQTRLASRRGARGAVSHLAISGREKRVPQRERKIRPAGDLRRGPRRRLFRQC